MSAPASPESGARRDTLLAIACILGSAFTTIWMQSMIRVASEDMNILQIVFFRNLFGVFVLTPLLLHSGLSAFKTKRLGLMSVRAVVNICAMFAFFYGISVAPLADVSALGFTAPIFATVLAAFFLGETVRFRRWAAILIGFLGAMVIVRPGFSELNQGTVAILGAAMLWASVLLMIRVLGRTESSLTITLYMGLFMAPLSFVPALFVWVWPSWEQLGLYALIALAGTLGQLLIAQALKLGETSVVMPFDFTKLLLAAAAGYLFFGETPTVYTFVGGGMIFVAATYIAVREAELRRGWPGRRSKPPVSGPKISDPG